jgi:phospholipid transport system substrate-binding protein
VKVLTLEFIDFDEFSRETLRSTWETLDPKARAEFVHWFGRLIQATYARHFKPRQELAISWRGETEYAEDKAQVSTTLKFEKSAVDVDYRFHKRADAGWWAYDLVIDEVSLMRNYRGQFRRILQKDGFDALMVKIKEATLRKENDTESPDEL